MSDGHARVSGRLSEDFVIGGQTYRLGPLCLGDHAEVEAEIVRRRLHPLDEFAQAVARLPEDVTPEEQRALVAELRRVTQEALRNHTVVRAEEVVQFGRTLSGMIWMFHRALRRNHPQVTLEDAAEILQQATQQQRTEIARRLRRLQEDPDLKNSVGPG